MRIKKQPHRARTDDWQQLLNVMGPVPYSVLGFVLLYG
jgi:hypothetical protein